VDLDRGQPDDVERVGDRAAVVGPGPGVDQDAVGEVARPVQVIDELALVVGLEEERFEARLVCPALDLVFELRQRVAAVEGGVAALEDVEVDPMQDGNPIAGGGGQLISSFTALSTLAGSTS
jgi:hypothetical protein